mmetsp:Transcript_138346/g.442110  ORF Transcript_138346/g.442110 Transcript_138346/m.442110 type:complete len:250 (-) Transcript_138346:598-1347(-)
MLATMLVQYSLAKWRCNWMRGANEGVEHVLAYRVDHAIAGVLQPRPIRAIAFLASDHTWLILRCVSPPPTLRPFELPTVLQHVLRRHCPIGPRLRHDQRRRARWRPRLETGPRAVRLVAREAVEEVRILCLRHAAEGSASYKDGALQVAQHVRGEEPLTRGLVLTSGVTRTTWNVQGGHCSGVLKNEGRHFCEFALSQDVPGAQCHWPSATVASEHDLGELALSHGPINCDHRLQDPLSDAKFERDRGA